MKTRIIPIFVPHRGCPHDCIFCNQKKITGVSTDITEHDVKNIIESYLETIDKSAKIEIAFFGGSFTAIDIEIQKQLLGVAKEYVDNGIVKDIRLSTRPDCIDDTILKMLKEHKVSIIELGVQSLDEEVLKDSVRGHDDLVVEKSSEMIKNYGFKLGLQMMVGLPSDNEEKCINTAKKFINISPHFVRIYPTLVVKDTGLEKLYLEEKYFPLDIEQTINIVKKLLVLFYINNVNVIRVGLQPTDDISLGKEVLCGPYHPALRELIESRIYRDYIENFINENTVANDINIKINKKNISKIIGNKKSNIIYINNKYNFKLIIKENDVLKEEIEITNNDKIYKITTDEIYKELYKIYSM